MATSKSLVVSVALVAMAVSVCIDWTQAQKTAYNQQRQTNSVYGGYQSSPNIAPTPFRQRPIQQQPQQQQQQFSRKQPAIARPAPRPVQQQPSYEPDEQQNNPTYESSPSSSSSSSSSAQQESDSEPASYGAVAGQPGTDFPNYAQIPKTSFTCKDKPYDGFYPDEETGCQAYHVCWENRRESFLCGVGTLFNAKNQHCDYWYNVECSKSSESYDLNRFFGTSTPENSATGPTQPARNNFRQPESSAQSPAFARRPQQPQQQQIQQQQQQQSEY